MAVRLFVLPRLGTRPDIRLLNPKQDPTNGVLYKSLPDDFALKNIEYVARPEEADFFVVPQAIKELSVDIAVYLDEVGLLAAQHGKKMIVFLTGDYAHRIHIDRPDVVVFKATEYATTRKSNEIIYAPFVEDLGMRVGYEPRVKGEKPVVSFCGYAGFPSLRQEIKYWISNVLYDLSGNPTRKRGIYYRKRAMQVLEKDTRFTTRFIVRESFSGNATTASHDARRIRDEYIQSIVESDFVLCPKGDANYSSRFYETLSLGRIPVLVDTDMQLPFESIIDYKVFVVRVPYTDIDRIGDYIFEYFDSLSSEEFLIRQRAARQVFTEQLRFDAYMSRALTLLKEKGIEGVL